MHLYIKILLHCVKEHKIKALSPVFEWSAASASPLPEAIPRELIHYPCFSSH